MDGAFAQLRSGASRRGEGDCTDHQRVPNTHLLAMVRRQSSRSTTLSGHDDILHGILGFAQPMAFAVMPINPFRPPGKCAAASVARLSGGALAKWHAHERSCLHTLSQRNGYPLQRDLVLAMRVAAGPHCVKVFLEYA